MKTKNDCYPGGGFALGDGRYGKRLPYCRFQSGTDGMCQLRTKGEEQYQVRERA